jgi:hypothetical protein
MVYFKEERHVSTFLKENDLADGNSRKKKSQLQKLGPCCIHSMKLRLLQILLLIHLNGGILPKLHPEFYHEYQN